MIRPFRIPGSDHDLSQVFHLRLNIFGDNEPLSCLHSFFRRVVSGMGGCYIISVKLRVFLSVLAAAAALIAGGCGRKTAGETTENRSRPEPTPPVAAVPSEREIISDASLERAGVQPRRAMWWRKLED